MLICVRNREIARIEEKRKKIAVLNGGIMSGSSIEKTIHL